MINENLNGFTIKSLISEEGGMAKVYYAENSIGKKAAVKVLRPKFFWDDQVKQRFINEAKTMVKLEHEHICSVYDLVVTDNYAAILLEYMEGDDLSVLLEKQKTFSEEEVIEYLPQICSALGMAHQKGVVHRDIKPSNLFLHKGKIKLMDFGIAQVKTEAGGRMTQTGTRMGSISYMSPEQIRSTKDVDLRTDIYSLGITIYQLLTGNLPYTLGKTDTDFAIMEKIMAESPKSIIGISKQMNELIKIATAKEPKERFASMDEMLKFINEAKNTDTHSVNEKTIIISEQTIIEQDSHTIHNNTLTDPDGNSYKTVKIGNQIWMAENLNLDIGSGCWCYKDEQANCDKYGKLYTWDAAKRAADKIPDWHLPTDDEWKQLEMYLGMSKSDAEEVGMRGNIGKKLKSTSEWYSDDGNDNNSSGFFALPGGYRFSRGNFSNMGYCAYFWTATAYDSFKALGRYLNFDYSEVYRDRYSEDYGYSIRLVRD